MCRRLGTRTRRAAEINDSGDAAVRAGSSESKRNLPRAGVNKAVPHSPPAGGGSSALSTVLAVMTPHTPL